MSDADHGEVATVEAGVTVEKGLNVDDFAVPSVVLTIRAPEDQGAVVRVRDRLPDDLGGEDVGFHPNRGGQFWTFAGDHVTFERRFEPGEEYTTIYGVAVADPERDEWLFDDPAVEVTTEPYTEDLAGRVDAVGDVRSGEPSHSKILERLARALEHGDPDDVRRIREVLSEDRRGPVSELAAELDSIDSRVSAMEEQDRNEGDRIRPGRERADISTLSEEISELRTVVEEVESGKDRNARDIDDVGGELAELTSTVESIAADRPTTADDRLDDLERTTQQIREDVEGLLDFRERIRSTLLDLDSS